MAGHVPPTTADPLDLAKHTCVIPTPTIVPHWAGAWWRTMNDMLTLPRDTLSPSLPWVSLLGPALPHPSTWSIHQCRPRCRSQHGSIRLCRSQDGGTEHQGFPRYYTSIPRCTGAFSACRYTLLEILGTQLSPLREAPWDSLGHISTRGKSQAWALAAWRAQSCTEICGVAEPVPSSLQSTCPGWLESTGSFRLPSVSHHRANKDIQGNKAALFKHYLLLHHWCDMENDRDTYFLTICAAIKIFYGSTNGMPGDICFYLLTSNEITTLLLHLHME